jgi:hypothetical protein
MPASYGMYGWDQGPSPLEGYEKGLNMRQLATDRQFQNQQNERTQTQQAQTDKAAAAERNAYGVGPDGKYGITEDGLKGVGVVDPSRAYAIQQQQAAAAREQEGKALEMQGKKLDVAHKYIDTVYDTPSLKMAKDNAAKNGLDVSGIPDVYDEKTINMVKAKLLGSKEAHAQQMKEWEMRVKEKEADQRAQDRSIVNDYHKAQIRSLDAGTANKSAGQGGPTAPRGKILPASQAEASGFANAASQALDDVSGLVTQNQGMMGPLMGRVSGVMGSMQVGDTGKTAASINAAMQQRAQVIGKYLEGGKLTDGDIERYKKQLPQLSDAPEVAQAKVDSLRRLLSQKQNQELEALQSAGYNTGQMRTTGQPNLPNAGKPQALPAAHPQDSAALQWAKQNPNDPRAGAILKMNGAQ